MENFEKVAIGLVLFVLTSVVAYLFRMRQLYVVLPKLFRHAPISKNGSLCELIVYNKGNQVEENIQVALDPELKGELLASGSNDIALEGSTLKIERLHKGCEASVMLLIENGVLDSTKIVSVSSKGTKGTVLKKVADVPPNFARAFLVFLLALSIFPAMVYGTHFYDKIHGSYVRYQLKPAHALGWDNLSRYYASDLRQSYSNQEFPIRYLGRKTDAKKRSVLEFEAYNKTAVTLEITANMAESPPGDLANFSSADVQPMSKRSFTLVDPRGSSSAQTAELKFTFKNGTEFLYGVKFLVPAQ